MPFLKEKWEAQTPKVQLILQIVVGILIAAACGYFITRPRDPNAGFFDLNSFIAIGLVLIIPKVLETQTGNPLRLMRRTMLIGMIVVIVGFVGYGLVTGGLAGPLINPSPSPSITP